MLNRYLAIALALIAGMYASCAHEGQTTRITTTPDRASIASGIFDSGLVVELDMPDWAEICVRQQPEFPPRYRCILIYDLREIVAPTLRARQ